MHVYDHIQVHKNSNISTQIHKELHFESVQIVMVSEMFYRMTFAHWLTQDQARVDYGALHQQSDEDSTKGDGERWYPGA